MTHETQTRRDLLVLHSCNNKQRNTGCKHLKQNKREHVFIVTVILIGVNDQLVKKWKIDHTKNKK